VSPLLPRLPVPAAWVPFELTPPSLVRSHGVTIDGWEAWQAPSGSGHSVRGCFGLDLSTWSDEATPLAFERIDAMAGSVGARFEPGLAVGVVHEERGETTLTHMLSRPPNGEPVAETFLGFVSAAGQPRLEACFVVCIAPGDKCAAPLAEAAPPIFVPPPRASGIVQALVLGMHHPDGVASAGLMLFLSVGALAVATRPRPRRK